MKAILLSLSLAASASGATILVDETSAGVHTTIELLTTGMYKYSYEFSTPKTMEFYIMFRDNEARSPFLQNVQGATWIYWDNNDVGGIWFLRDFAQAEINEISFETTTPPVSEYRIQYSFTTPEGWFSLTMIPGGYGPAPSVPEAHTILFLFISAFGLLIRRR